MAAGTPPFLKSELFWRTISGLVLAPIVVFATWWGGFVFAALAGLVAALIVREWMRLVGEREMWIELACIGLIWLAIAALVLDHRAIGFGLLGIGAAVAMMAGRLWVAIGIAYAGLAALALVALRGHGMQGFYDPGFIAIVFVLMAVWSTDVMAYFVGRLVGGPKLWPRVSPNKTWSGALGGFVAAIIVATGVCWLLDVRPLWPLAVIAGLLSIAGQLGDLFESHMKRKFGLKDSGHLIPGHGGIMDRVDGLIFAAVAAMAIGLLHAGPLTPAVGLLNWGQP